MAYNTMPKENFPITNTRNLYRNCQARITSIHGWKKFQRKLKKEIGGLKYVDEIMQIVLIIQQ